MFKNKGQPAPMPAPFDVNQLEEEVRETMPARRASLEIIKPSPLPDYVEHIEEVDEVGRLSAEAIVKQYEAAAKEVESLGDEIKDSAAKLTAILKEHDEDMRVIAETAQAIRDKGKAIFIQIENASRITTELRRTCSVLKENVK